MSNGQSIGMVMLLILIGGVVLTFKEVNKKKRKKAHGHGTTHTETGGHAHEDHPEGWALFWSGLKKKWWFVIPFALFLWCVMIPWACAKRTQYKREAAGIVPTPDYMAWNYTLNHTTGYTVMRPVSIGDSSWDFEGAFHKGLSVRLKVGEVGEIINSETSPPTRGWIKLTTIPHKGFKELVFNGIYVDELPWSTTTPPPEIEWHRFSLVGKKL